jgi:phosphate transport system permease protein
MSNAYFPHAAVAAEKLALPAPGSGSRTSTWGAWLFVWGMRSCAAVAAITTLLIVVFLCAQSLPVLHEIGLTRFFTDQTWAPTRGQFNLLPMMVGTLYATVGAVLLAGPCGIAVAIFALFYAPTVIARLLHGVLGLLAGIPSVVFGLWGLVTLVPLLNYVHPPGLSLLMGIIIVTLMILPTIALIAEAALRAVPREYTLGGAALGCTQWQIVRDIVLPSARSGLLTAVLLGAGRALGETMAVSMVMGNTIQIPESVLAPARTLTAHIGLEMAYAMGSHRAALFVAGLWLLVVVVLLVGMVDYLNREERDGH